MRKLMLFLSVILIICFSTLISFATADYIIDDRADTMIYSSASRIYLPSAVNGSVSSLSSGNSVTFQSWGSELYVYCARYTNSGYVAVYIDNEYRGKYDSSRSTDYSTDHLLCSFTDLSESEHNVLLVCTSDYVTDPTTNRSVSPRFYFDYIEVSEFYKDYYTDSLFILLGVLVSVVFCILIFKILEFWRHLKNDN